MAAEPSRRPTSARAHCLAIVLGIGAFLVGAPGCASQRQRDRAEARPAALRIARDALGCDEVHLRWLEEGEPLHPGVVERPRCGETEDELLGGLSCDHDEASQVPEGAASYARLSGCGDVDLVVRCSQAPSTPTCAAVGTRQLRLAPLP